MSSAEEFVSSTIDSDDVIYCSRGDSFVNECSLNVPHHMRQNFAFFSIIRFFIKSRF